MVKVTEKLARWRLSLSELKFAILYRVGVKHQAVKALSRLKTKGEDKTVLSQEVPVLTIPQQILACAPENDIADLQFFEEP